MTKLLLMYGRMQPTQEHLERLVALDGGLELVVVEPRTDASREAVDAQVFLGHSQVSRLLPVSERLEWIQSLVAGVDHLASPALFRQAPIVTRCPIFSDVIAAHAVTMAYSVIRRIPEAARMQEQGALKRPPELLSLPSTALILGLGEIGREIALILRALGVFVRGVASTWSAEKEGAVDEFVLGDAWRDCLPESDLCFVALPSTRETDKMIDRTALEALPHHAVLVNVGRGQTVDTEALVAVLEAGHLGGAALDVIDPTPQADDDLLWRTPRLLITPHIASFTPDRQPRIEQFVEEQVARFLRGEPLLHQVDLKRLSAEATDRDH